MSLLYFPDTEMFIIPMTIRSNEEWDLWRYFQAADIIKE